MYCVRFKADDCTVGYLRPWNSVRDGETYSLTYLTPSIIDGIADELGITGKILRHKFRFSGMTDEFFKSPEIMRYSARNKSFVAKRVTGLSKIHQVCSPEIILGFENKEDAENAIRQTLYAGQTQYIIFPSTFVDDDEESEEYIFNESNYIEEMTEEEFSALSGTETFPTTKEDGVFCGFNRYRDNEKMYINIVRTK